MVANTITLCRLLLTFVVIFLFGMHHTLNIGLIATIVLIFVLDGIDGYVARRRNETSKLGEVLDTLADRIIENTFWIYFTVQGAIPLWIPIVVMSRGFLSDALQRMQGYPENGWRYALTRSRGSRAVSGLSKLLAFTSLASTLVFETPLLLRVSRSLALVALCVCLVRGLPFMLGTPKKREV